MPGMQAAQALRGAMVVALLRRTEMGRVPPASCRASKGHMRLVPVLRCMLCLDMGMYITLFFASKEKPMAWEILASLMWPSGACQLLREGGLLRVPSVCVGR